MYWSWTLPWTDAESLLGILIAENVEVFNENGIYSTTLISIGLLVGRVDIIYNMVKKEEENEI